MKIAAIFLGLALVGQAFMLRDLSIRNQKLHAAYDHAVHDWMETKSALEEMSTANEKLERAASELKAMESELQRADAKLKANDDKLKRVMKDLSSACGLREGAE